jgi:signal transduction histidine kinase/DNA-binding response OmpR family regulator
MDAHINDLPSERRIQRRALELLTRSSEQSNRAKDRMFLWLLMAQWAFAILLAVTLSPLAWEGRHASIHPHMWTAIVLGGLINALPVALIILRPGSASTRYAITVAQMLWSALLIHLTSGRIETHFHVFGSLAFLAAYKETRLLIIATLTVAADHFIRGLLWPESVYGSSYLEWWRFLEHAGWVVFEVVILGLGCERARQLDIRLAEREARLEEANADVERQVIERTEQLRAEIKVREAREEELRRAQAVAEAASRAKSQFMANMSHEIRTPMNGVLGFTNLLLDTPLSEEQREHVQIIRQSGESLLHIINDILDFSKVEAGKLDVEKVPFDLRQAVEEVAELLSAHAEQKGLELALRIDAAVPSEVDGDPGRVRQILTNLLGNAIKFTRHGHVVVEVDLVPAANGRPAQVRCAVTDTGIGVPSDKHAVLFQEFSQADGSTTREFGGTGLGLTIARRLAELMGGTVDFTSEAGKGSCFWFTLPLTEGGTLQAPARLETQNLTSMRVLVVDDFEINRRLLGAQLTSWDIAHVCVESGEAALAELHAAQLTGRPYDVALLDYLMPGMDGMELGKRIKADPTLHSTSLIMITSGSQRSAAQTYIDAGFCVFLMKPVVRPAQLLDALTKGWLARVGHTSATRKAPAAPEVRPALPPAAEQAPGESRPYLRVLVAEDNAVNQRLVKRMLEKLGCRVDIAADGREAVQMATDLQYDVVFMDCSMPEMDGFEATGELRRRLAGRRLPIIALTANAMAEDRAKCLAAGMDDYLSKPARLEDIRAALERWFPRDSANYVAFGRA